MGVMADAVVRYGRPLIDETDGSPEQLNQAMMIVQLCWNLALCAEDERGAGLARMQETLAMDDSTFADLRDSTILPMVQRHEEMFPDMHGDGARGRRDDSAAALLAGLAGAAERPARRTFRSEAYPSTGRNEPCPCGSGKKYKKCCLGR